MSKVAHLIEMLITLQYKKLTTASELADVLQVDKKTIYRYINNLNLANIPVHTKKGRYGGFYIDESFYMKPPKLSFEELQSLIAVEKNLEDSSFPFKKDLRNAVSKIKSICVNDDKELAEKIDKTSFKIYNIANELKLEEKIDKINYSMEKGRSLSIEYFSHNKNISTEQTIAPYNLIFRNGDWYIVAYSHIEDKVRGYKLSRIKSVDVVNDIYIKPRDFSLGEYLSNFWGDFNGEEELIKIKFSKNVSEFILKNKWSNNQQIEKLDDGSVLLKIYVENLEDIKTWILGFGGEAEVIEPISLKNQVKSEIKKLVDIYQ
ncbi:putative DNA-binding transcriptional regulator YafY [Clostridium tetanomorphum]|uniref:helix-turn-helix transcriptional regulator n=1 Tax=Clostridium tetanomorphum TaxID=1553 RepID=UPI00044ACD0E|nr:transcriptional regulator [Clostridium tetanomorphum]KAJ51345.1 hypothetical protein CTM_13415 [Clostridium tetanomorphum DSM 665]MBP1866012.1 putative DNA-binding transcriptional regulator YafY [Clostridium tetanomorphum]NRS85934.1 putative DNA-binding transcriptional regulator YafY [Clostridium tetanomorphum]SQB89843.1 transcriptional regulator [Clostridium tetanomorphum]